MNVIFVVGGLYTEASGVARIVCDLANGMAQVDQPVTVYTAVCNGQEPASHMLQPPNTCVATDGQWMWRLSYAPELRRTLAQDMPGVDVVHQHSIWMLPNHYGSKSARQNGKPVLFTAHGFLEPWALDRSRWKKRLVGAWFQDRDLKEARCIHVNSLPEIKSIRDYGLTNPIAVIPNGVDPEPFEHLPARSAFEARYPEVRGKKIALRGPRLGA
jgi:glycosyltransferase involved in cell wall biosynthesis